MQHGPTFLLESPLQLVTPADSGGGGGAFPVKMFGGNPKGFGPLQSSAKKWDMEGAA